MLQDEKILITGPAGQIAFPLTAHLAASNEVWGIARFGDPGARARVDALGVTTRSVDIASGDFEGLPDDFTHVIHLAVDQSGGLDYDRAITVNAEGTGLLLQHCRSAKAALVMSTHSVYKADADPMHVYRESDPLGDANSVHSPAYSVSKIAQEAVARTCARAFDLPVTIARMNCSYGANGGLLTYHLDWILGGQSVVTRWDPCPYSPIHQDDINEQAAALLAAATVPATIVNWAGDEAVSVQEWCRYIGELTATEPEVVVRPVPGTLPGSIADVSLRQSLTGPCRVTWRDGIRRAFEERYPDGVPVAASNDGQGSSLRAAYDEIS